MSATIGRARIKLGLDVNFGDPVNPAPVRMTYPQLRPSLKPFRLLAYPLSTVLAEKLVTSLDRGDTTTRIRDYVDLWTLIRRHDVNAPEFIGALRATAGHRNVPLVSLSGAVAGLASRSAVGYQDAELVGPGPDRQREMELRRR
jgi:hypothetical protein